MDYTTSSLDFVLPDQPFTFNPLSLYAQLCQLPDHRGRRGRRYRKLAPMLLIYVLAKLGLADHPAQIADWAKLRATQLIAALKLTYPKMPHPTTWRFWLQKAVDATEFNRLVGDFFAQQLAVQHDTPARACLVLALDGKLMRHAIPADRERGLHLLAVYAPDFGCVLAQVEVGDKQNEITAAPKLLELVDLRGAVVTGDAMFAQRHLAAQIMAAGGDYLFIIKANQLQLQDDIAFLFAQEEKDYAAGAQGNDFVRHRSVTKVSGRLEERIVTSSEMRNCYALFPHLGQVIRVERESIRKGKLQREVVYGVTSLPRTVADAARLQELVRGHWEIENGLHWRRDMTLHEDSCVNHERNAGQVIAAMNNLVVGLGKRVGRNLAAVRRYFNAYPAAALKLLTS